MMSPQSASDLLLVTIETINSPMQAIQEIETITVTMLISSQTDSELRQRSLSMGSHATFS
jgi:hypothetical protein